jgi:hypothetical protein
MKTQKLNIKVWDLEPLKDVTGGRHRRHHGSQADVSARLDVQRSDQTGLGPFGLNRPQ